MAGDLVTVRTPCYCNREDVKRALDFAETTTGNTRIDRAMQSTARTIEGFLHRVFWPQDRTRYFDWPNQGGSGGGQYAYPWRLWLDQYDIVVLTSLITGGVTIPLNQVFLEPVSKADWEPFTYVELDRSSTAAFGGNAVTPQHSIAMAGTWGYGAEMDPVATLAVAVTDAAATTITVSDSSQAAPGDLLILNPGRGVAPFPAAAGYAGALGAYTGERVLVADSATADTGQAQVSGCELAADNDNALTVADGTQLHTGEVLLLDSERMLITDVTGDVATVQRAFDGTALATHSGATVYAYRLLTVVRGYGGTTAATYSLGAAVSRHRPPPLVRDLAIAESLNRVLQETSGYSRMVGAGDMAMPASGAALADLWDEARTTHGRKARTRAV